MNWRKLRKGGSELDPWTGIYECVMLLVVALLAWLIVFHWGTALGQEPISTKLDTDPGGFAEQFYQAFTAKEWGIFVGCLIMLIVWVMRLFVLTALPSDWLPWVSSGLGVLLAISIDLTSKVPWWKATLNGLLVGSAASGMWSMLGKKVLPSERKTKEDALTMPTVTAPKITDSTPAAPPSPLESKNGVSLTKVIVLKSDTRGDDTVLMDEESLRKLLKKSDDEPTEPNRKAIPDDAKSGS